MKREIRLNINGKSETVYTEESSRLLDVLREEFFLTGTKEGCAVGECGACTIVINGQAVNSCLVLTGQCEDSEIITIEGLEKNGELHELQKQFMEKGAIQCGFCTPGMVMSAYALVQYNPDPTLEEIKEAIEGNLCRCTGYTQIIEAIEDSVQTIESVKEN
jgi:carbon-monoxide dehydrogenase small subunit